ncbi:MAG: asparaginyl-tRNA synthetase [Kosmotogales bacterium]|nr:asparaginyl-tRNA synthetase [Kosmotogales bacterium]
MTKFQEVLGHLTDPKVQTATKIKAKVIQYAESYLRSEGFIELLPTMISPLTDPLNHEVVNASFDYYGTKFSITQSMIFHKQIALNSFDKIFIVSPNVRLETSEKMGSGVHLYEFTQVDLEVKGATREDIMEIIEKLFIYTISKIKEECADELKKIGSDVKIPKKGFPKVKYLEGLKEYGEDFESIISKKSTEPFWLIDIPLEKREFYDRLSSDDKTLLDMDLILPYGYGEALSGGEREFEYETIIKRMKQRGNNPEDLPIYSDFAKEGKLPKCAGCGFGVERLTRYICGLDHVSKTRLFPKIPGKACI